MAFGAILISLQTLGEQHQTGDNRTFIIPHTADFIPVSTARGTCYKRCKIGIETLTKYCFVFLNCKVK